MGGATSQNSSGISVDASLPKFYLINLQRSPDRLIEQTAQFGRLGLSFERIEAIDANRVTREIVAQFVKPRLAWIGAPAQRVRARGDGLEVFIPEIKRYLTAGEIGCYLSHIEALQQFVQSGHWAAVILEDDIELDGAILQQAEILEALRGKPVIVKLEGIQYADLNFAITVFRRGNTVLRAPFKPSAGAAAYFVTREAAVRLVPRLLPIRQPYDLWLRKYWSHGLPVLEWRPFVARQKQLESLIAGRNAQPAIQLTRGEKLMLAPLRFWLKTIRVLLRAAFVGRMAVTPWRWNGRRGAPS
jgi:glycosyl transferase family 25